MNWKENLMLVLVMMMIMHVLLVCASNQTLFRVDMSSESCPDKTHCVKWKTSNTYIKVNGVNMIKLSDLGFYIVTIVHVTGKVDQIRHFNTHADKDASKSMANFISALKQETIILGVSYGDSGKSLTTEALDALFSITGIKFGQKLYEARLFIGYNRGERSPYNLRYIQSKDWSTGPAYHRIFINRRQPGNIHYFDMKSRTCDGTPCPYLRYESQMKSWPTNYYPLGMLLYKALTVIVIEPVRGAPINVGYFSLDEASFASLILIDYFKNLSPGFIVIGTAHREYTAHLTDAGAEELAKVTKHPVPRIKYGGWVFVGYTGTDEFIPNLQLSLDTASIYGDKYPIFLSYTIQMHQGGRGCVLPPTPSNGSRYFAMKEFLEGDVAFLFCNRNFARQGAYGARCKAGNKLEYLGGKKPICTPEYDECTAGVAKCPFDMDCINLVGTYTCKCKMGYTSQYSTCVDIDECKDPRLNFCKVNSVCVNTAGSYRCDCKKGYARLDVNGECEDINECTSAIFTNSCPANSRCKNTIGSFSCICNQGYRNDSNTCIDIDECAEKTHSCPVDFKCFNTPGKYECRCDTGYEKINGKCIDINECESSSVICPTKSRCVNTDGSYTCKCDQGYAKEDGKCIDIDECQDSKLFQCSGGKYCVNKQGGYSCKCKQGYKDENGICIDVNECTSRTFDCDMAEICNNLIGSYECKKCDLGFLANEEQDECVDIDECVMKMFSCPKNFECVNTVGAYECKCSKGFQMKNGSCEDKNECSEDPKVCPKYSKCKNTIGGFNCTCVDGFVKSRGVCYKAIDKKLIIIISCVVAGILSAIVIVSVLAVKKRRIQNSKQFYSLNHNDNEYTEVSTYELDPSRPEKHGKHNNEDAD